MPINKEKIKKTLENFAYVQIGLISAASKLVNQKVDEFIVKGKEVAGQNKDVDAIMKTIFNKSEEDIAKEKEDQHVNDVLNSLTPEELEKLKSKLQ